MLSVIAPLAVLVNKLLFPVKVIGLAKLMAAPTVTISARCTVPVVNVLIWLNSPDSVKSDGILKRPLLSICVIPPPLELTAPLKVKAVPVRLMPEIPVIVKAPKVEETDPAFCLREDANIAPVETIPALLIVRAFKGCVPPTMPEKVIFPLPAAKMMDRVLSASPSRVKSNRMLPPFDVSVTLLAPLRITGRLNSIGVLTVVMLAPR